MNYEQIAVLVFLVVFVLVSWAIDVRHLRRSYRPPSFSIENIRVDEDFKTAGELRAAISSMRAIGHEPTSIELTPKAYMWLCREMHVQTLTHVAGVPVKVIDAKRAS